MEAELQRVKAKPRLAGDKLRTSPHLVCLEKIDGGLRFVHFGNLYLYETPDSDLSLRILRLAKSGESIGGLLETLRPEKPERVKAEIDRLLARAYIYREPTTQIPSEVAPPALRCLVESLHDLKIVAARLAESRVGMIDFGDFSSGLQVQLEKFGIQKWVSAPRGILTSGFIEQQDFFLVLGEPRHRFEFSRVNQELYRLQKPWMLVTFDLYGGVVGPTFGIAGGPCYDCIVDHSKRHYDRRYQGSDYVNLIEGDGHSQAVEFPMADNVMSFAATETAKVLSQVLRPMTYEGFFTFDLFNYRMNYAIAAPSPTCPVCSGFVRDK